MATNRRSLTSLQPAEPLPVTLRHIYNVRSESVTTIQSDSPRPYLETDHKPKIVPVNQQAIEAKRRRRADASSRHRARKKEQDNNTLKMMEELKQERDSLTKERDVLQSQLVICSQQILQPPAQGPYLEPTVMLHYRSPQPSSQNLRS